MLRIVLFGAAVLGLLTGSSGCAICQAPDDCAYAAYGGVFPRADMYNGRVGSAFDPAGGEMIAWEDGAGPEELEAGEPEEADGVPPSDPEATPDEEPRADGLETAY